ncbi:Lysine-specific demethylase lid [Halotydeus destructor]|nr:Lysine-specific demethylase lid [Halotydeus destructor]
MLASSSMMEKISVEPERSIDLPKISFISHNHGYPPNGGDFEFVSPPEAPIFRPTEEEFANGPLAYVAKIKPLAESYGICKIIPPASFQPPFAVDVESFRFTPRVQRLNELEAQTRIKFNFLEQVVKFWDLQGSNVKDKVRRATLKIPSLDRKTLDLYQLHKVVQEEGGFETCTRERKWSRIALKMGFNTSAQNKGPVASLLRQHYERILFPYDVFLSGATIGPDFDDLLNSESKDSSSSENSIKAEPTNGTDDQSKKMDKRERESDSEDSQIEPKMLRPSPRRLARKNQASQNKFITLPSSLAGQNNKELKKLQVYGAGPKMPGFSNATSISDETQQPIVDVDSSKVLKPILKILNRTWRCARCIAYLVQSQPQPFTHEFGFAQSQRDYSLSEFGEIADNFKADYFRMEPHKVPLNVVEREFWRIVACMEDTVTVEYGADLHTNDYGSGFPTPEMKHLPEKEMEYAEHAWNLNNLPILEGSVFKHINTNISGMIVPWMYVGMCFSTFCWHNEDHWSYSINYLHWGEPKSWYGVPGEHADTFERAMKRIAPELFESQPDLLHQLVTICNPNILMQDGVPIYKVHQNAGEFVVTFPRAYHAGYNQGLNFAEAVNFAPPDWLPIGRVCMTHYSRLHRYPVFSHDELICKMGSDADKLGVQISAATYHDMLRMVDAERKKRLELLEWGVTQAEREAYELLPDDERQCEHCKTTCFLSAVTCVCSKKKLVCIYHKDHLCKKCEPSDHTLRYRYTLDELPLMLHRLKIRASKYDWSEAD